MHVVLVIPSQTVTQNGSIRTVVILEFEEGTTSRNVSWVRASVRDLPRHQLQIRSFQDSEKMAEEKKVSIPSWVAWWQFITGIICIIDATYIILRPRTMKSQEGDLNWLYSPCKISRLIYQSYNLFQ